MPRQSETAVLASLPGIGEGREYLIIGPNCWGRDRNPAKALQNAKKNRVSADPKRWKWLAYDVPAGAWVDEMGYNVQWKIPESGPAPEGIALLARFNTTDKDLQ